MILFGKNENETKKNFEVKYWLSMEANYNNRSEWHETHFSGKNNKMCTHSAQHEVITIHDKILISLIIFLEKYNS